MPSAATQILRQHHRRRRGAPLLWAGVFALLAALAGGASRLGWWSQAPLVGAGFGLLALVCLATWFALARRLTRAAFARRLDAEWRLSSRLESAHEVDADPTLFASALRADADVQLAKRTLPSTPWWHLGLGLLALALLLGVGELGTFAWHFLKAPAAVPAAEAPADIAATIDWRKPASEIKASAIEEISLVAETTTATGFRQLTLEASINGRPVLSRPLEPADLAPLAKPGTHPIALSLYLDEIDAQPFDIVAYYLHGDRLTRKPGPAVDSPLQFIQIRPARDDVEIWKAGSGEEAPIFQLAKLIGALKAAQLALLKQNFLLAHAPLAKTDPVWIAENTRVAADQDAFAAKVVEAREFAIKKELPTLVVDHFGQIEPLARQAAALIAKTDNEAAAPIQGRILGLVTALEKLLHKIIMDGAAQAAKKPDSGNPDPFKDEQKFRLPPRLVTPAGQLEELAEKQTEQTKENEKSPDASPGQQAAAAQQAALAQKLAALAAAKKLDPAAQQAAEQAARDAAKAAEQLKQGDSSAARSPAAAAAQTLKDAVAAQEKAGRDAALAQLDASRRALNEAAALPDPAERAARLAAIANQLHAEALAQQETGSAEAARQLEAAALSAQKASEAAAHGLDQKPSAEPGKDNAGEKPGDKPAASDRSGDHPAPGQGSAPAGLAPAPRPVPVLKPDASGDIPAQAPGSTPGKPASGQDPSASPLENATETAALAEIALSGYRASLERALRQLSPTSGSGSSAEPTATPGLNDSNPAPTPSAGGTSSGNRLLTPRDRANLQLAAQLTDALVRTSQSDGIRRQIESNLRTFDSDGNVVMPGVLGSAVDQLRVLLEAALGSSRRDETVRRYNPDDIPPAYRDAVERYFEELSRAPASSP